MEYQLGFSLVLPEPLPYWYLIGESSIENSNPLGCVYCKAVL